MPKPTIYDRPRIPGPRAVVLPPELAGARVIIRPRWWPLARLVGLSYTALALVDFTWRLAVHALVLLGWWPW